MIQSTRLQRRDLRNLATAAGLCMTVAACLGTALGTGPAQAQSFRCDGRLTDTEFAICQSGYLGALDEEMATNYNLAVATNGPSGRRTIERLRNRLIAQRDRCRMDEGCIAAAYRSMIDAYGAMMR